MRYRVGAEQVRRLPPLPDPRGSRATARTTPIGPTYAVAVATGVAVCGVAAGRLHVLDEDWEGACLVEKCPACDERVQPQAR